jgi:hypothetical protein
LTSSLLHGASARRRQHGSRHPQARNVPPSVTSSGAEAIQLAAKAGLNLDGWQADFLADSLGEDARGNWACFECGLIVSRQNGKGSVLEARVLAGLLLFGEKLILWSAHEMKTAIEAFRRCEELFTRDPELKKLVKAIHRSNGNEGIELKNGARLKFVARSKGSGRGFSADLVILDEAYALTPEQMAALIPTLSSRPNPQIWYTSSPPLDGMSGEHLFNLRTRALKGDDSLCWYDYGLQGVSLEELETVDLGSEDNWLLTNPAAGIRIALDFVRRELATMPPADFARERLGIWPRQIAAGSGVIDPRLWAELADPASRPGDLAFAVDINPARTHAAIVAVGTRPANSALGAPQDHDGPMQIAVVAYAAGTDWVPAKLAQLRAEYNPIAIGLDVKGPGGSLLLDLEKVGIARPDNADEPERGDLAIPTAGDAAAAFGLFVDAVRQRQLFHSDDNVLDLALAGAKTRALAGGSAWDRKGGTDISPLVAATLAYWSFLTRKHLLTKPQYDPMVNIW